MSVQPWTVAHWVHNGIPGSGLVCAVNDELGAFWVASGPSPWVYGTVGPFPLYCVTETRPATLEDSWVWPGTSDRWTIEDLLEAAIRLAGFAGLDRDGNLGLLRSRVLELREEAAS